MQIVILGAGGVGGYLGARLTEAGCNPVFLVRGNRLAQLQSQGLRVMSTLGDVATPVTATNSIHEAGPPDLVILTCTALGLESAIEVITPVLGAKTRVLPFLNGVRHLQILNRNVAPNRLLGGLVHGALNLRPDGVVEHLSPFFSVVVGAVSGETDYIVEDLVKILKATKVDARLSSNIVDDMWGKFVFLTTLAGITCLMRANIGTILQTEAGEELISNLFCECLQVAEAEQHPLSEDQIADYKAVLIERGSSLAASMLRHLERGQPTEWEHILADMLQRAVKHNIEVPMLRISAAHLDAYERQRIKASSLKNSQK